MEVEGNIMLPFLGTQLPTNIHMLRLMRCTLNPQILASCYAALHYKSHVDDRYKSAILPTMVVYFDFHPIGVTSLKNVID